MVLKGVFNIEWTNLRIVAVLFNTLALLLSIWLTSQQFKRTKFSNWDSQRKWRFLTSFDIGLYLLFRLVFQLLHYNNYSTFGNALNRTFEMTFIYVLFAVSFNIWLSLILMTVFDRFERMQMILKGSIGYKNLQKLRMITVLLTLFASIILVLYQVEATGILLQIIFGGLLYLWYISVDFYINVIMIQITLRVQDTKTKLDTFEENYDQYVKSKEIQFKRNLKLKLIGYLCTLMFINVLIGLTTTFLNIVFPEVVVEVFSIAISLGIVI